MKMFFFATKERKRERQSREQSNREKLVQPYIKTIVETAELRVSNLFIDNISSKQNY